MENPERMSMFKEITNKSHRQKGGFQATKRSGKGEALKRKRLSVLARMLKRSSVNGEASVKYRH